MATEWEEGEGAARQRFLAWFCFAVARPTLLSCQPASYLRIQVDACACKPKLPARLEFSATAGPLGDF